MASKEPSDTMSIASSQQPLISSTDQNKKQSIFSKFSRRTSSSKKETGEEREARLQKKEELAAQVHQKTKEGVMKYRGMTDAQAEEYLENKKKNKDTGRTTAQVLNAIVVPSMSQHAV